MEDSSARQIPPIREDCWSEEATATLIEAWGRRYMELSRGNLRQKDWQEVAETVNPKHGHSKKTFRTDVQCKNRIDTIKKKYKTEKAKVTSLSGVVVGTSGWRFYDRLDELIGPNVNKANGSGQVGRMTSSPPMALPLIDYKKMNENPMHMTPALPTATRVMLPKKRPASTAGDDSYFRRNYSAVAAAVAAAASAESEDEVEEEEEQERSSGEGDADEVSEDGLRKLADAIKRFGEIYARVEDEKQRQMVELEKQRMEFVKELELQRMQMFMNTQVQLEKIKRSKVSGSNGETRYIQLANLEGTSQTRNQT